MSARTSGRRAVLLVAEDPLSSAPIYPVNDQDFTQDELKWAVLGPVDLIWLPMDCVLVVNRSSRKPFNSLAGTAAGQSVYGDALLCPRGWVK